jgi:hypothetical protein
LPKGAKFGRKPKLAPNQLRDAIKWRDKGILAFSRTKLQHERGGDFEAVR